MTWKDAQQRLNDLDADVRRQALEELLVACRAGEAPCQPSGNLVNMHCHTIFSYNGYGHSPSSLAWLALQRGWHALGTVDFDVLDAVEETLQACDLVGVRGAAGLETRVYVPEFATREINSPGEPGVCYYVGEGFVSRNAPPSAGHVLEEMRARAAQRNRDMVERINAYLGEVVVDYERDILSLTPSGNATERHVLVALDSAARRVFADRAALVQFWSEKLGVDAAQMDASLGAEPGPNELMRPKLMKRGGVGYVQPGPETFPPLQQVAEAIAACGAIPSYAWLDGASAGEQAIEELLGLMIEQGASALTVIPERNWNYSDAAKRAAKLRELYAVVELARSLDLPIIAGTEMNKAGQPLVDDIDSEPLLPLRADIIAGADFLYGHTVLQRALGLGYQSEWARAWLPSRRARNAFYIAAGESLPAGAAGLQRAETLQADWEPDRLLAELAAY